MRIHQGIVSWLRIAWFWVGSFFYSRRDVPEPTKTYPVYDQDGKYVFHAEAGRAFTYGVFVRREDGCHEIRQVRVVPDGPFKSDNGEYLTIYRAKNKVGPEFGAEFAG